MLDGNNNNNLGVKLEAEDPDNDPVKFRLVSSPSTGVVSSVKLDKDGKLLFTGICSNCTATEQVCISSITTRWYYRKQNQ